MSSNPIIGLNNLLLPHLTPDLTKLFSEIEAFPVDGKLSYPYRNNNNNVYMRFLLDEAEEFFKEGVKKLTQAELCISESTSTQLTTESYLE